VRQAVVDSNRGTGDMEDEIRENGGAHGDPLAHEEAEN
jgi:hypothetical protein